MQTQFTDKVALVFTGPDRAYRANTLLVRTRLFNKHLGLQDHEYFVFELPPEQTDGISIPRFLWPIMEPHDWRTLLPAMVHDHCYAARDNILTGKTYDSISETYSAGYKTVRYTRLVADKMLREKMRSFGGGWLLRNLVYLAVRCCGWASYKKR